MADEDGVVVLDPGELLVPPPPLQRSKESLEVTDKFEKICCKKGRGEVLKHEPDDVTPIVALL